MKSLIWSTFKRIDSLLPGEPITRLRRLLRTTRVRIAQSLSWLSTRIVGDDLRFYQGQRLRLSLLSSTDEVGQLCDQMGSDKGSAGSPSVLFPWDTHGYSKLYSVLFAPLKSTARLIFECGIGTTSADFSNNMTEAGRPGASLRVWERYFSEAKVIGADIDPNVLFQEGRISTFIVDQTDSNSIQQMWSAIGSKDFDIMIDDGLHKLNAAMTLFDGSWGHLRSGGIYVIEDVARSEVADYLSELNRRDCEPTIFSFDRTRSGNPDHCLCVIVKR